MRGSRFDRPEEQLGSSGRPSIGELALLGLRLVLGLSFLQVGYKLFREGWNGWTNASVLLPSVGAGHMLGVDPFLRRFERRRWWYWMLG